MKMTAFEKIFVNSPGHSRHVSHHAETLLKLVEFRSGQKYLDVGCGNGAAPIHLAQQFYLNVTGIDVDPDQIREAEKGSSGINHARFLTVDATELPFENDEFDIVSTNKVMHHIPNWNDALAEMVRVLKPNGYFIYADIVVPVWLAALGKAIIRKQAGFPTSTALNAFVAANRLAKIHLSTSPLHYEGVFQKSG